MKMVPYEAFACRCGAEDVVLRESYKPKTCDKLYYACPQSKARENNFGCEFFYGKRNESVYWIFNDSKIFSKTFNTSKLFTEIYKKCRVLKWQALAWKDKDLVAKDLIEIMSPRIRTRSDGRPAAELLGGGTGVWVGRGGRGRRPREGNDERVDDLNGQGNDQGLRANRGVEGVNENVERVNRGVGGALDFSTIIAQQLQNLLPAMLAQVGIKEMLEIKMIRTLSREVAVSISWNDFKCMMIEEFCPSHEMQKLESELWNHAMVGVVYAAYTDRFHELAR
ncbi:hypothetical protein Tco_1344706 [Tanacetum coccineum]